jgi:hypothetical protein
MRRHDRPCRRATPVILSRLLARARDRSSLFEALRLVETAKVYGRIDECEYANLRRCHARRYREIVAFELKRRDPLASCAAGPWSAGSQAHG